MFQTIYEHGNFSYDHHKLSYYECLKKTTEEIQIMTLPKTILKLTWVWRGTKFLSPTS